MHKNLKKEANRILLHLAKQCFELRASFIIKNETEKVEKLKNEESLDNVIKKTRYHFYDETDEERMNRVSGEVSYSKVKQHLRQFWIVYKCVYR